MLLVNVAAVKRQSNAAEPKLSTTVKNKPNPAPPSLAEGGGAERVSKNNDTMKKVEVEFGVNINVKRTICMTDEAVGVLEKLSKNNNEILLLRKGLDKDLSSVGFDIIASSVKLSLDVVVETAVRFCNIKWRVINDDEQ